MGMDVGGKKGGAMADINVTPLVDVVLVLLIIFMVVTQMLSSGMDVKLPEAKTSQEVRDMGQFLVVSILPPSTERSDPQIYIDRSSTPLDGLVEEVNTQMNDLGSKGVLLKGSKRLKWKDAYKVLETMSSGGYSTLLLATEKEKE